MKCSSMLPILFGAASAGIVRRATDEPCKPLKNSVAPEPNPNTAENFESFGLYSDMAKVVVDPPGFEPILVDANATVVSDKYMYLVELKSYDLSACAQECNANSACKSFNIYFQRNPSIQPAEACPNPGARTLVQCGLYNQPLEAGEAVNKGQSRGLPDASGEAFQVIIRGSNIYNRIPGWAPMQANRTVAVTMTVTAPAATVTVGRLSVSPIV